MTPTKRERKLQDFGTHFHEALWNAPFGSLSKSEIELAYFAALVESRLLDLENMTDFELGRQLKCTPTRASNLRFNYQIRRMGQIGTKKRKKALANHVVIVDARDIPARGETRLEVILNVENRFWRNVLIEQMKKVDVFSDTSFNRERVVISARKFVENAPALFGVPPTDLQALIDDTEERKPRGDVFREILRGASTAVGMGAAEEAGKAMTVATFAAAAAGLGLSG